MFLSSNDGLLGANKVKMPVDHPPAHASAGNAGIPCVSPTTGDGGDWTGLRSTSRRRAVAVNEA